MSEKSTRESQAAGEYRPASPVTTPQTQAETAVAFENGRVVSTARTADSVSMRITTRSITTTNRSTE
jgi:hypothetical protein